MLYFLSKTVRNIIRHCPASAKNVQASYGFFVLLTGILAFFSGSYAISNMFLHVDELTQKPEMINNGWTYSFCLGFVYGLFIMAIDREVVSASTKWAAALRIPLAFAIGLIVSVPVELKIFEGRIVKHLIVQHHHESNNTYQGLNSKFHIVEIKERIKELNKFKKTAEDKRDYWSELKDAELVGREKDGATGIPGKGKAYGEADSIKAEQNALIASFVKELKSDSVILANANLKRDSAYRNDDVSQSFDLLTKYIALKEVKIGDKTGSAKGMGLGITILFCLFEVIPSLIKLLSPQTEYDVLLNKRRRLNMSATNAMFEQAYTEFSSKDIDEIPDFNKSVVEKMYETQAF